MYCFCQGDIFHELTKMKTIGEKVFSGNEVKHYDYFLSFLAQGEISVDTCINIAIIPRDGILYS